MARAHVPAKSASFRFLLAPPPDILDRGDEQAREIVLVVRLAYLAHDYLANRELEQLRQRQIGMIGVHFRDNRQAIGEVRAALDLGGWPNR